MSLVGSRQPGDALFNVCSVYSGNDLPSIQRRENNECNNRNDNKKREELIQAAAHDVISFHCTLKVHWMMLFVGFLTSQQHVSVSQGTDLLRQLHVLPH